MISLKKKKKRYHIPTVNWRLDFLLGLPATVMAFYPFTPSLWGLSKQKFAWSRNKPGASRGHRI